MNKQRKTSNILNVFQYDETTGAVTLPSTLVLTAPAGSDNSTKVPTTAWTRSYISSLGYVTGNQSISITGDATGSGSTSINLTLANTAVTPGTYGSATLVPVVTVDSKGRITSVTTAAISGALTFTGDVTGTGTTGSSTTLTLANSGVTAGTFTKVTVDSKGRVTVGANATTSDISEGTNLYYTDARVLAYLTANNYATQSYVGTQIANLVDAAPGTLDTLNELAAALGDDPNFATTISTSIGTKVPQARTLTINGTTYDLTANRSWTINSMVYPSAGIALSTGTAWGTSITDNSANWNTAYGWGNHASAGYLTSATAASTYLTQSAAAITYLTSNTASTTYLTQSAAASTYLSSATASSTYLTQSGASSTYLTQTNASSTYASLTGAYANPAFVASLAYSKITGVPAFLTSYTETDPYRVTAVAVSGTSTKTITLTRADASTVTTTWTDYDTDTNTYVTSAGFSGGTLTLTRNDSGTVSVSLDGRYALSSHNQAWSTITSTPTTLSGYGISDGLYSTTSDFTTAGTGWYRVATTSGDGRGTYYVEVFTTGGNHNPAIIKIYAHGDWGSDKLISVETDGGFPASAVRITRSSTNTFLEVNFTTQILGASLRVTRLGFNSGTVLYSGSLPAGGDTVKESLTVNSRINTSSLSISGNAVLHAGNYNSYSPTLTGGGASGTWGISITGNAATVGGYSVSGSVGANTVVIRDSNNYIYAYYINSSVSESENPTINSFFTSNGDGWLRKSSLAHVRSQLGNYGGWITGYTETDTLATVTARGASTTAGITVNGRVTAAGGGTYAVTGSSTQRYIIQALNTSNSVNSSYGWWWFHNTNGDMGFHADAVGDILTLTRAGGATVNGNAILTAGNYTSYTYSTTDADSRFLRGTTSPGSVNNFTISIGNNGSYSYVQSHSGQALRLNPVGNTIYLDSTTYAGVIYSTIIYDSNDSSWYLDPNSTSVLRSVKVWSYGNGTGDALQIYTASNHQYPQIYSNGALEAMWNYKNSSSEWYVGIRTSSQLVGTTGFHFYNTTSVQTVGGYDISGNHYAIGSSRAPIFYDSADTSYYVDPNSTSRLYYVNAPQGYVSVSNPWGTSDSAYFPNGITTAGGTNWVYGTTYIGNAPGNGNGHQFWADGNMRSTGHHYLDWNYGQTIVGLYSSTRYQGIFAMGDSYKLPLNGTTTGSLYGLAWSHPNAGGVASNLNTHGLLVMENGTFLAAISGNIKARDGVIAGTYMYAPNYIESGGAVYGTIFYDNNDRAYYCDPNSLSNLSAVRIPNSDSYASLMTGIVDSSRTYADGNRKAIVINADYYPSLYLNAFNGTNTNHGAYIVMSGTLSSGGFRQWTMGIANYNPGIFSIGFNNNMAGNGHYGIGDNWSGNDAHHGRLIVDIDGNTKIRGMLYVNGTSGGMTTGSAVIHAGNIGSQSVAYSSNSGAFNGWGVGSFAYRASGSGYYQIDTWMSINGNHGIYWPSYYGLHLYPNQNSYGALQINGAKNGWAGIHFNDSGNALMMNSNESGHHREGYGWQFRWTDGTLYCHKNSYGGGTAATVLDSSNVGSYAITGSSDATLKSLRFTGVGGDSGNGSQFDSYAIYQQGGGWGYPYPDLCIGYHTGIKMGAYWNYGGIRIYNNADWATITASFHDGDQNFRGYYDIIAYASDRRLKHNIQPIENALEKVISLTGMTYQWNEVGSQHGWEPDTETREAGVFAQDVQAVLPEAVKLAPFDQGHDEKGNKYSKSGENFLTVKYEKIVPLLIEAIKEQQKQIEELQNKLDNVLSSR